MASMFERTQQLIAERQQRAADIRNAHPDAIQHLDPEEERRMRERQRRIACEAYCQGVVDAMAGDLTSRWRSHEDYDKGRQAGKKAQYRITNKIGAYAQNQSWQRRLRQIQARHQQQVEPGSLAAILASREQADREQQQARRPLLDALRSTLQEDDGR